MTTKIDSSMTHKITLTYTPPTTKRPSGLRVTVEARYQGVTYKSLWVPYDHCSSFSSFSQFIDFATQHAIEHVRVADAARMADRCPTWTRAECYMAQEVGAVASMWDGPNEHVVLVRIASKDPVDQAVLDIVAGAVARANTEVTS